MPYLITILGTVGGYALGTAQIVGIEWWRRRRDHKKHLRALRWEVRRLLDFDLRYNWTVTEIPDIRGGLRPPRLSELFLNTLGDADLWLTDEHDDDNTYRAMLDIVDNCRALQETSERIETLRPTVGAGSPDQLLQELEQIVAQTEDYDRKLDDLMIMAHSMILDLDRRLDEARFARQLRRQFRTLGKGENPTFPQIEEASRLPGSAP